MTEHSNAADEEIDASRERQNSQQLNNPLFAAEWMLFKEARNERRECASAHDRREKCDSTHDRRERRSWQRKGAILSSDEMTNKVRHLASKNLYIQRHPIFCRRMAGISRKRGMSDGNVLAHMTERMTS